MEAGGVYRRERGRESSGRCKTRNLLNQMYYHRLQKIELQSDREGRQSKRRRLRFIEGVYLHSFKLVVRTCVVHLIDFGSPWGLPPLLFAPISPPHTMSPNSTGLSDPNLNEVLQIPDILIVQAARCTRVTGGEYSKLRLNRAANHCQMMGLGGDEVITNIAPVPDLLSLERSFEPQRLLQAMLARAR